MDFEQLTRDLETQDETIRFCSEAIRRRGVLLKDPSLIAAAAWLVSDQGRGMVIDVAIEEQMAASLVPETRGEEPKGGTDG